MFPARLPIVGKSWLSVNLTVAARLMHVSAPGARRGVKSVNLCELSVPGTEARCRPSHYRLSDDPQLRTEHKIKTTREAVSQKRERSEGVVILCSVLSCG